MRVVRTIGQSTAEPQNVLKISYFIKYSLNTHEIGAKLIIGRLDNMYKQ